MDGKHQACSNYCNLINLHIFSKTLRVWELDLRNRKIRPTDCNMGQLKRIIKCIKVGKNRQIFQRFSMYVLFMIFHDEITYSTYL